MREEIFMLLQQLDLKRVYKAYSIGADSKVTKEPLSGGRTLS